MNAETDHSYIRRRGISANERAVNRSARRKISARVSKNLKLDDDIDEFLGDEDEVSDGFALEPRLYFFISKDKFL